jgi:hypothetical protein
MSNPEASNEPASHPVQSELPDALRALLNTPTYVSGANTLSFRMVDVGATYGSGSSFRTRGSAATEVADIRSIAEGLMFDTTKLVSIIEAQSARPAKITEPVEEMVPVVKVLRGGSALIGSFAVVCSVGSALSGSTLIHPLLAAILFVSSLGFFFMSLVPSGKKYG